MVKKMLPLVAVTALVWSGFAAGCTPEARQDVKEAGQNVGQATEKSAEGTVEATQKAGTAVKEGAEQAGEAVGGAAKQAGAAVKEGAEQAGEAVGGAAKSVKNVGTALDLTPGIKAALVADKSIDASTINVDTKAAEKQVILSGSVPSDAIKQKAQQVTQAKLKEENSDFKIVNKLAVSKK